MKKMNLRFNDEMFNDIVGSLVICHYMLCEKKPTIGFIKRRWIQYKKRTMKYDCPVNPEHLIEDTISYFKLNKEPIPIAEVKSDFNTLFLPFIDGELYPIREDGVLPQTAQKAKTVTPILWESE